MKRGAGRLKRMFVASARSTACMALVLLAACGEEAPDRQVVASITGDEVTRRDLGSEPLLAGETQAGLLDRVIDRKLLASAARQSHVEDDPQYLADLRRTREELLVAGLERRLAASHREVSPSALRAYADASPWRFAERRIVTLEPVKPGQGGQRTVDTAMLDRPHWRSLVESADGVLVDGQRYRVVSNVASPLATGDLQVVRELWQREQVDRAMSAIVAMARSRGEVHYAPGTGPSTH